MPGRRSGPGGLAECPCAGNSKYGGHATRRWILQAEVDLRALLQSAPFIEGVRLLRKFDLHFEITVTHRQMDDNANALYRLGLP
jgi:hypothetical protein